MSSGWANLILREFGIGPGTLLKTVYNRLNERILLSQNRVHTFGWVWSICHVFRFLQHIRVWKNWHVILLGSLPLYPPTSVQHVLQPTPHHRLACGPHQCECSYMIKYKTVFNFWRVKQLARPSGTVFAINSPYKHSSSRYICTVLYVYYCSYCTCE